jgi:hypothetical protein
VQPRQINQVKILLDSFGLFDKVIAYVKDERSNSKTLTFTFIYVVSYFSFWLTCPFVGSWFGYAMSKVANMLPMIVKYVLGF